MNKFAVSLVVVAVIGAAFVFYQFQKDEDQAKLDEYRIAQEEKSRDEARRNNAQLPKDQDSSETATAESEGENAETDRTIEGQRVVGRLVDDAGNPIAGETVTLTEIKNSTSFGILEAPGHRGKLKKGVYTCKTADDGSFYFAGVKHKARLEVRAWPQKFRAVTKSFSFFSGNEHDVGDLVAEQGAILAGRVLNGASIPVAGAEVSITVPQSDMGGFIVLGGGNSRDTRTVISDQDGYFRAAGLKSGKARISTRAKGFPPKEGLRADLTLQAPVEDFVVQLDNGREIYGTVVDADGKPATNVTVEFQPASGFNPMYFGQNRPKFPVDDQGKFVLTGVPVKDVKLRVYGDGYMTTRGHLVPENTSTTLVKLDNAAMIYGYLKTKSGKKSIKDFDVKVTDAVAVYSLSGGSTANPPEVLSGADAARKLGLEPSDGFFAIVNIAKSRARFQVDAKGYEQLKFNERNLKAGEKREVAAEAARDVPFAGVVMDANGDPVADANIVMTVPDRNSEVSSSFSIPSGVIEGEIPEFGGRNKRYTAKSSADGTFEIRGMVADTYKMNVRHDSFLNISNKEVILEAGKPKTDYTITLSSGATLTGVVFDEEDNPLPGARVSLKKKTKKRESSSEELDIIAMSDGGPGDFGGLNIVAGEGGVYTYKGVAPGEYTVKAKKPKNANDSSGVMVLLSASTSESGGEPVLLKADTVTELDLRIKKKARVFGRVLSGSRPIVGAKVSQSKGNAGGWGMGGGSASADDSGYYEIADLEPGKHTISLALNGSPYKASQKVELAEGQQLKVDFSVPTGTIMGRVTDSEGNPIAGARVTAQRVSEEKSTEEMEADRVVGEVSFVMAGGPDDGEESSFISFAGGIGTDSSVTSDDDGYYEIPYLAGGIYDLKCRKSGYSMAKIDKLELAAESTQKNADFVMNAACKLTVRATTSKKGSVFFNVQVEKIKTTRKSSQSRYFQSGGSAKFTSLTPGTYRVTCSQGQEKKEEKITIAVGDDQELNFEF